MTACASGICEAFSHEYNRLGKAIPNRCLAQSPLARALFVVAQGAI